MADQNRFLRSPFEQLTQGISATPTPTNPNPTAAEPIQAAPIEAPEIQQPAPAARSMRTRGLLPPPDFQSIFEAAAAQEGVPLNALAALGQQESTYNPSAIGTQTKWGRAKGLMQYIDPTANSLGINPFDPEQSIYAAARQMRERLDKGYSIQEAIMAHHGGDDRRQWGPKTRAYGEEVLAKAGVIGGELLKNAPKAAPEGYDLGAIQAELDAKEPGRYKVASPEEVERYNRRDKALNPSEPLASAQQNIGKQTAPSPLTVDNQRLVQEQIDAQQAPLPLTIENQVRAKKGMPLAESDDPIKQAEADARGFIERAGQGLTDGVANVRQSLENANFLYRGGDSQAFAGQLADKFKADAKRYGERTSGQKEIDAAFQDVTNASGFWDTLKAGSSAVATSAKNYKDTAVEVLQNAPNMLPTMAAGIAGAGAGAATGGAVGAAAGAPAAGVGAIPGAVAGAVSGAVWGGRGGMLAGTTVTEAGAEFEQTLIDRLQKDNKPPTKENIAALLDDPKFMEEARVRGAAKGVTVGLVDQATMFLGGKLTHGAVKKAKDAGQKVGVGRGVALGAAGVGLETAGEVTGEALSQLVARGEVDKGDALREGVMSLGQSVAGAGIGYGLEAGKAGGQALADSLRQNGTTPPAAPSTTTPAASAPATPAQPSQQPTAAAAPAPAAPQQPAGPLSRAAATATQQAGEVVTMASADGAIAGTLDSYVDHGNGNWTARVTDEEGNSYDVTQDDGVTIERQQGEPLVAVPTEEQLKEQEQAAEQQAEKAPAADETPAADAAPDSTALADDVADAADDAIAGMDEVQLRAELKRIAGEIRQQPKDTDAGKAMRQQLTARRREVEQAINNLTGQTKTPAPRKAAEPSAEIRDDQLAAAQAENERGRQELASRAAAFEASQVQAAADQAATSPTNALPEPTDAQREAGNFKMGHAKVNGLDVTIEIPAGGKRRGTDAQGNAWEREVPHHYGYIKRTKGADQENVDVYLGPKAEDASAPVYVVDQVKPDSGGAFDEHKVMMGFGSARQAEAAYRANFPRGMNTFGGMRKMSGDEFKAWLKDGDLTQRVSGQAGATVEAAPAAPAEAPAPAAPVETPAEPARSEPAARPAMPRSVSVGPAGFETRPIGGKLYRETSVEGLNDLLRDNHAADGSPSQAFVTDNIDLALGQGENKGVVVQFRGDAVSGREHRKPGTGDLAGREYRADYIGQDAIDQILLPKGAKLGSLARTLAARGFDRTQLEDGRTLLTRKGVDVGERLDALRDMPAAETAPAPAAEPAAKPAGYGAENKLVSADRAAELRERLKAKLNGSQLNAGIDPEILAIGTELAVFHIEASARKFGEFARAMATDLDMPLERLRPYLRSWYNGARDMMEDNGVSIEGMDSAETVRSELAKLSAPAAEQAPAPAVERPDAKRETVATPAGREIEVRHKVVEADDLVTSNNEDGSLNAAYPQELQPRDRSRAASQDQINDIAGRLNPRLLGESPSATDGAPIVSGANVVESGNGRTLAIRRAYARDLPGARAYREWLASQGHDVAGMRAPVLVRERMTELSPEELRAYTGEANERTTLAMSATERAIADGAKMGEILHLYRGGDVSSAANRDLVRAFVGEVAAKSDRGSILDGEGLLSQEGRRRIEGALLASAYGDGSIITDLFESADSDIKAIGGALLDVSGTWAQMRQEARDGVISSGVDVTPNLIEAVNVVRRARAEGRPVAELVNQNDIFAGQMDPVTTDFLRVFYRGENFTRARGRDKVAGALAFYTEQARASKPGANLFGDPEVTGADIVRGTNERIQREDEQARQQSDLFGGPRPDVQDSGAPGRDGQGPQPGAERAPSAEGESLNAPDTGSNLERDRQDAGDQASRVPPADGDAAAADGRGAGRAGGRADGEQGAGQRDQRVSPDGAPAGGARSDQPLHRADGEYGPASGDARDPDARGSRGDSVEGSAVEQERADAVEADAHAPGADDLQQRLAAQRKADGAPTKRGDKASIDAALPLLLPEQRDDVLKAEQRLATSNGILFTNGTGTGKTASGLGIVKRELNAGNRDIVVVVPSDKIASDWVAFGKMLGIDLKQLESSSENGGSGPIITTYANFGQNESLLARDWTMAVADESHYLSSNADGETTAALEQLRAITGHHSGFYRWVHGRYAKEWGAYRDAQQARADGEKDASLTASDVAKLQEAEDRAREVWAPIEARERKAWDKRWLEQKDLGKAVFLSATPFPYVKNTDYAEGYLFHYTEPKDLARQAAKGSRYNSGDGRQQFMMARFGYRMRYNKLTAPEAGVNSELLEQQFNQWLKDTGALSGRRLEVPFDYDRKFALVEDAVGRKIDQGLEYLREAADGKYRPVYDAVMDLFDHQSRMYLLESIKARAAVPMIKEHLALGRKVVVFHDYNKGGGFDPFNNVIAAIYEPERKALAREAFGSRPDLFKLNLRGLASPIDTLSAAFPDALFFNGTVPKAKRRQNADLFNQDGNRRDIIVVQSDAGREGVSLHDTTGKHQRVEINLGMPTKPVAAVQIEGRIYRTGQASDAIFRYLTTGTAWETSAFATKIAERASTAENLALGNEARGLKQAFIDAYQGADLAPASAEDGKGGKAYDRSMAAGTSISGFDKAKTFYWAQQKNTRRRDQREGSDYYATPEPVGFKMVEWADVRQGDKVLEPSAGHGAIARFFPDHADVTMVEPSYDLSQRAALANGNARIVNDQFEGLHISNKYDAIVMNPPYGSGGKIAIDHVAKAAKHLRDGGRVVALIPRGGMADQRLANFLAGEDAKDLHLVARIDMPAATFERAGTKVNTQILVLERHDNLENALGIQQRNVDLSNAQTVNELFDRIEGLDVQPRTAAQPQEAAAPEPVTKPARKAKTEGQKSGTITIDGVEHEVIQYETKKKKILHGIVRTDLTYPEAKAIDEYTWKMNGGYFIRTEHLTGERNSLMPEGEGPTGMAAESIERAIMDGTFAEPAAEMIRRGQLVIHDEHPGGSVNPNAQAFTDRNGTINLVASNMDPADAQSVLLHEAFHAGAEKITGSRRWQNLQERVGQMYDAAQRRQAEGRTRAGDFYDRALASVQAAQRQGQTMSRQIQVEEFAAYAVEHYEQAPAGLRHLVDTMVGAIKDFIYRRLGIQLGDVSAGQLRGLAAAALRATATEPRESFVASMGDDGIRYSVKPSKVFTDLNQTQKDFLDKIGPQRLPQRLADRWRQLTDNLGLRIRQAGVDRFASLLRNDKALLGDDTLEGSIASSAWVLARMAPAAGGAVHALMNAGRIYLDAAEKVVDILPNTRSLSATLRELGSPAEIDRFMGWIAANRSKGLLAEGRENLFTRAEIEEGIKLSAGKLADGRSRSILYSKTWKEFQQHRDDVLGIAETAGIITPEQRQDWASEFYVPFYRVLDEDTVGGPRSGSGLSRQQAYQKLKGGKQHLNDLLENTLLNFHHLIQASLKNQAAAQALENAKALGIADTTTESKRDKKASTFVMVAGEKQWYNVSDNLTFKAVSALSDAGLNNPAMKIGRAFKRFFTNMTTVTPQFVVANALRDTLSAMATSPTSPVPFKTAFTGALTYWNNHDRARMMASGGAFSFGYAYGTNINDTKAALTGTMRGAKLLADPKLIPSVLLGAWRQYHKATDFVENVNRAGIWERNLPKGKLKAAFEARDLMDFSAHGESIAIRIMTDLVPFLNARIQGLDKLYRSGGKPAIKVLFGKGAKSDKQAFARFGAVTGALMLMSGLLFLQNYDDEDYRKLEDWQRDTYWPIKIGGSMYFIPKPFEVGAIATMGERLLEQFLDPTVGGEKFASRFGHMLTDTFAFNPLPQVAKPLYELGANKNTFTGRPIEDQSMQKLSPSLRSRPETSRLAEGASRGIEATMGLVGAGNMALSPVQIDHLIQGYAGAAGATAVGLADTIWRRAGGEQLPARNWYEYQPIKRFYKNLDDTETYTRYGTDFYEALKKSDQAYADFQNLIKYGEEDRAAALEKDKATELGMHSTLTKVQRSLSRISAEMKQIQTDKKMDGETKRLELDRLRSMRNLITEEVGKELETERVRKRAGAATP